MLQESFPIVVCQILVARLYKSSASLYLPCAQGHVQRRISVHPWILSSVHIYLAMGPNTHLLLQQKSMVVKHTSKIGIMGLKDPPRDVDGTYILVIGIIIVALSMEQVEHFRVFTVSTTSLSRREAWHMCSLTLFCSKIPQLLSIDIATRFIIPPLLSMTLIARLHDYRFDRPLHSCPVFERCRKESESLRH